MSNVSIPNLPPVIALSGPEQFEVVQGGISSRATINQIGSFVAQIPLDAAAAAEASAVAAAASATSAAASATSASTSAASASSDAASSDASAVASSASATAAALSAEQALQAATTAQGFSNTLSAPATALPFEVRSISGGIGTGSGGTPGTYVGGVSDGPAGFMWSYTIGADGKLASYAIDNPGIATTNAVPTLSFPLGGLVSPTIPTATVNTIPVNRVFLAPSSDGTLLLAWINNAGALSQYPTSGTQYAQYTSAGVYELAGSGPENTLDISVLKGVQIDYTTIANRPYSALYNLANYSFSASASAGIDIAVGEIIQAVDLNVQTVSATPPVSAVMVLRERSLSSATLNTTAVSSTDVILETLNLDAASLAAMGLTGGGSTTNLPFVSFVFAGSYAVRSGYAYSFQLTFYDGASGSGNKLQVYTATNNATGIDQYRRGFRFSTPTTTTWTTQPDGFGFAWRFTRKYIPDAGNTENRVTTLEAQRTQLVNGIPLVSYIASSVARTGFFSPTGSFFGWSFVLDVGAKLAAKTSYDTIKFRLSVGATGTIKLYAYHRLTDSPQINTAPSPILRDRTLLPGYPITIDTSSWVVDTETEVTVALVPPFIFQIGDSVEFAFDAFDGSGNSVKCSTAFGATSSTQHERGWYRSTSSNVGVYNTPIASNSIFYELTSQRASVSSSGGSSVSTYGGWAVTGLGATSFTASTFTVSLAGSTLSDASNNSYPFGGTLTGIPATAAGNKRYDGIYVDTATLLLTRITGTSRTDSPAEWPPSITAGTQLLVGFLAVGPSGVYDFMPRWDVVSGIYRISMQSDFLARQQQAKSLFEPIMNILTKGGSIATAIDGDSITQLGPSGANVNVPNGANRDQSTTNYLNTNLLPDTIAAANIQSYTDPSGAHTAFGLFREFWGITVPARFNATVTASNFGANGNASANGVVPAHMTAIANSLSPTDPCVFHIAWGMNDLMSNNPSAFYNNLLTEIQTIQAACPKVVVIVHGVHRPNDNKTGYNYTMWLNAHNALEQAALKTGAIFIPNWAGYEANRGIIGIAGVDRCTANLNTAAASNHPGIREHWFMRDLFKALVL